MYGVNTSGGVRFIVRINLEPLFHTTVTHSSSCNDNSVRHIQLVFKSDVPSLMKMAPSACD